MTATTQPSSSHAVEDAPTDHPEDARPLVPLGGVAVAVLALLTAVGPLSIDMYLPAFPAIATELGSTATGVQLTMTTFLAGLAIGQLVIGPLSDGVGRRRPLIAGVALCLLACVLCAVAPSAGLLALGRFLQGLGGAAGLVLARAIVADGARGPAAARLIGVLTVVSVIAPVVAPLAGGTIIAASRWRTVFWVLAGAMFLMLVGVLAWVRESLPRQERSSNALRSSLVAARELLTNRTYVGYTLTFCLSFAGLFAYIAASPFVLQNIIGLDEMQFSLAFAANAVAITATSALAAALAGKVPYRRVIAIGLSIAIAAAAAMVVTVLAGVPMIPVLVLFAVFQGSLGLIFGNATTLALEQAQRHAGTGSAFLGFGQFLLAAIVSPLVGIAGEANAMPMAVVMVVCTLLAAGAYQLTRSRA